MSLISGRSLIVDENTLGRTDEKFVLKHTCGVAGCGKDFSVQISKLDYDTKVPEKRRYKVRCSTCGKKSTFSEGQTERFERLFGKKATISDNVFDKIFDVDE